MGLLFQGINATSGLAVVGLMGALIALNEIARRNKWVGILVFTLLPLLLALGVTLGLLGSPTGKTWFGWVKVVSALAGVYGFMAIRYTKLGSTRFAFVFPGAILALNIAEAVYRELQIFFTVTTPTVDAGGILIQGGIWNVLNATAGLLCILTLTGFGGIAVSKDKSKDMVWPDMTWAYIVGYTLWNFTYVFNCISNRSMYAGFAILAAALISELLFKRGAWLQHRAQILSLYAIFSLSVDFQSIDAFKVLPIYEANRMMALSTVSLIFNLGVMAYILFFMVKGKKNPLTHQIFSHAAYFKKSLVANNLTQ